MRTFKLNRFWVINYRQVLVFIFSTLFLSQIGVCQKAKIITDTQELITTINAITSTELYTASGNIETNKIHRIFFERREDKFESTYSKISNNIIVEFGDGSDIGELSNEKFKNEEEITVSSEENRFVLIDSIDLSKDELYARAKTYIAYSFKSAQDVIQLDDKDNGKIIAKGNFTSFTNQAFGMKYFSIIEFTFTIDVRDGKFRGIIENLYQNGLTNDSGVKGGSFENEKPVVGTLFFPKNYWVKVKEQGRIDAIKHLEDFSAYMKKKIDTDDF